MTSKVHIYRDEGGCAKADATWAIAVSLSDFHGKINSSRCKICERTAIADKARQRAYEAANARHPLPISGAK